ncbi:hypothetical protein WJX72_001065 [[Myrmecia] bisecta]|uniref:J domain-containing protein n=1 Tax=[Myrmecia] bisecta TaxID=41462 RepID=A0AAW1PSA4_9CHLO
MGNAGSDTVPLHLATDELAAQVLEQACKPRVSPWDILGLQQGAQLPQVKAAYKRLVLRLHPDKTSSKLATEAFKAISTAFLQLQTQLTDQHGAATSGEGVSDGSAAYKSSRWESFAGASAAVQSSHEAQNHHPKAAGRDLAPRQQSKVRPE